MARKGFFVIGIMLCCCGLAVSAAMAADDAWKQMIPDGSDYSRSLRAMWMDSLGGVWVVYGGRVFQYPPGSADAYPRVHKLPISGNAIWGWDANNIFVVGDAGGIAHFDGAEWSLVINPLHGSTYDLYTVSGSGPDNVFCAGESGRIMHYDGTSWTLAEVITSKTLNALDFAPDGTGYAVGDYSTVLRYDGQDWSLQNVPLITQNDSWLTGVLCTSDGSTFMWDGYHLYYYNGSTWMDHGGRAGSVYAQSASSIWVASGNNGGEVLYYNGTSWQQVYSTNDGWIPYRIIGRSGSDIVVCGSYSTVVGFDGAAWTERPFDQENYVSAIWGDGAGKLWAGGALLEFRDGYWWKTQTNFPQGASIRGLAGRSASEIFAACRLADGKGAIMAWDGASWSIAYMAPSDQNLRAIWVDDTDVFAAGLAGCIFHYDGQSWEDLTRPDEKSIYAIWGDGAGNVYFAGSSGTIHHFNGTSWVTMPTPSSTTIWGLGGAGANEMYAVGNNATIWRYTGGAWQNVTHTYSGNTWSLYDVRIVEPNNIYAVGSNNKILHYDGSLWTLEDVTTSTPESLCIWADSAHSIYVGQDNGGILHKGSQDQWLGGRVICKFVGRPVAFSGAQVTLKDGSGITMTTGLTDSIGEFLFEGLADGAYSITVTAPNTSGAEVSGIIIAGAAKRLSDIELALEKINGTFTQEDIDQAVSGAEAAKDAVIAQKDTEISGLIQDKTDLLGGDMNLDGAVTTADLAAFETAYGQDLCTVAEKDQAVAGAIAAWDASGDGSIGLDDAINALQKAAGKR